MQNIEYFSIKMVDSLIFLQKALKLNDAEWHVLTVSRRDPETGEYTMEKAPCYHLVDEDEEEGGEQAAAG